MITKIGRSISAISFLYVLAFHAVADELKEKNYYFYISKTLSNQNSAPSISVEKASPAVKWFDDFPSQSSGARTEIGVINKESGYTFSFRDQTIQGKHLGAASKYSCFLFFCAWIDGSIVSGLNKSDEIDYSINMQQIWVKKTYDVKALDLSWIVGINNIKAEVDITGASNHLLMQGSTPIPFVGTNMNLQLAKKIELIYDLHYSKISRSGTSMLFMDTELELAYQLVDFLKLSIGENRLIFNVKKKSDSAIAELNIPQRTPYLKISLIY